mgnify:FL=1
MNIFLTLFFVISACNLKPAHGEERLQIKGLNLGIYEKGTYMGIFTNLNDNDQLNLRLNYFKIPIGKYDIGLSESIKLNFSSFGAQFNYRKYFQAKRYQGFFTQTGIELNNSSLYSRVNLSELDYRIRNVTVLCPSCSSLELSIKPKAIKIIPSLSLGWTKKLTKNISLDSSIGVQFLKINNAEWEYNSNSSLPFFVREEIEEAVEDINSKIQKLPYIYPTARINLSYYFK